MDVHFSSLSNEWETPKATFQEYNDLFHFGLDAAATKENALCKNFYTIDDDALSHPWGELVLPLELLSQAKTLINILPLVEDVDRDFAISRYTTTNGFVFEGNIRFLRLYEQIRANCLEKFQTSVSIDNPFPTDPFIQLARFLTINVSNPVGVEQEFNRRLVNHLDESINTIIRGISLSFLVNGIPFVDTDTSLAVEKSSGPTNNIDRYIFIHILIIHALRGLINDNYIPRNVFCNPPYGKIIGKFIKKGYEESCKGCTVVFLVPSRTDTRYFHDYCIKYGRIRFFRGRLKFDNRCLPSWKADGSHKRVPAPFPSCIVIFGGSPEVLDILKQSGKLHI